MAEEADDQVRRIENIECVTFKPKLIIILSLTTTNLMAMLKFTRMLTKKNIRLLKKVCI